MAEMDLETLKKHYSVIQKKHNLPSFEDMNKDFHIEGLVEIETEHLARAVRKFMSDKLQNYLRFVEAILNPSNAPMFIFSVIKTLNEADRKKVSEIYKKLSRFEIDIIELDTVFSEEKDVKFIKEFYSTWQEVKKDMIALVGVIRENWDKESGKNSGAYLG